MPKRGPKATPLHPALDPAVRAVFESIERRDMTLREVSHVSGVGYGTILGWRLGENVPTIANLRAVANTVGLDLEVAHAQKA